MKKSRFSEEQIAYAHRQVEGGAPVGEVCRLRGAAFGFPGTPRPQDSSFQLPVK